MRHVSLLILIIGLVYVCYVPRIYDNALDVRQALIGSITDYYSTNPLLERKAQEIVKSMSDAQLAGQVLMPAWEHGVSKQTLRDWICHQYIGGFMILGTETTPQDIAGFQEHNTKCQISVQGGSLDTLPLFVSIDAEPTLIAWNMRVKKLAPHMVTTASLTTPAEVVGVADTIHTELSHMGVTMNFAPVVDSNANKAIISERSFGGDSANIRKLAKAFNKSAIKHNIIPTIKHFPGHGKVVGDSHKGLVTALSTLPELPNFKMDQGTPGPFVPMVMVGHIAVQGGDYDTRGLPATLSPTIMQDLLRDELGYTGVVITDAMNMGAVSSLGNTTLRTLEAGTDIVLMPLNIKNAHREILAKIQSDDTFKTLILQKVTRIIRLKIAQDWAHKNSTL